MDNKILPQSQKALSTIDIKRKGAWGPLQCTSPAVTTVVRGLHSAPSVTRQTEHLRPPGEMHQGPSPDPPPKFNLSLITHKQLTHVK